MQIPGIPMKGESTLEFMMRSMGERLLPAVSNIIDQRLNSVLQPKPPA
jgi:hypothetical protein